MKDWMNVTLGRLTPYWATVITSLWILGFLYVWTFEKSYELYDHQMVEPMLQNMSQNAKDWGSNLVGFMGPTVLLTCFCALLLTDSKLPMWKLSWVNKVFSTLRRHRSSDADYGRDVAKKNQFAIGDPDFNLMALWLIVIPMLFGCFGYIPLSIKYADMTAEEEGKNVVLLRWEATSYLFGWASVMCLVWFLIPVSRHSILLVAMGWSPIHALRIHIWAGYLSFIYMMLHGLILVVVWFTHYEYPVWKQIIPAKQCWKWHPDNNEIEPPCNHVFWNWTGLVAAFFFIILWATSLDWVRRSNYRLFYWSHVICGTMLLLTTIMHMHFYALYLLPSSTYYLASTMPTLIQALASRFRGGVKISKVTAVPNSGGCVEVQVETNKFANAELDKEPCLFVKLCVPKLSLIWHPFTVYKHPNDPSTVRFLFRPIGPFTKKLAELLTSPVRPVTMMDGFYRGADRAEQALQHDCVTIVTGGVAITPFLSMIPSLLTRIRHQKGSNNVTTKRVIMHWICREQGLINFVVERYLNDFLDYAKRVSCDGFHFEVKIYLTGNSGKDVDTTQSLHGSGEVSSSDKEEVSSNGDDVVAASDMTQNVKIEEDIETNNVDTTQSSHGSGEASSSGKEEISSNGDDVVAASDMTASIKIEEDIETNNKKDEVEEDWLKSSPAATPQPSSGGHVMELARMMPGRYSHIKWNVPLCIAISVPSWLMFWYVFSHYEWAEQMSYYDLLQLTWVTIYSALAFVAFAVLVEGSALLFRKYWPEPRLDDYEVDEFTSQKETVVVQTTENVTLEFLIGRPSLDALFDGARQAEAPGIFMCGPVALTHGVRKEAAKENSRFGLTRYALYDEPFEM